MALPFQVFSCSASRYMAEKICASLGCELGKSTYTRFSDGEFGISYDETIRGRYVFIVQSTFPSADNLMELLLMIDAAKSGHPIGWGEYCKYMAPATILVVLFSMVFIFARYL